MDRSYCSVLLSFFLLILNPAGITFARQSISCDGSSANPCIVLETLSANSPVSHLRDTAMIAYYYAGNISGVASLKTSASAIPNESGWNEIIRFIAQQNPTSLMDIVIVDLRQETHGYVDGLPVNLMNFHNWINVDKTAEQVKIAESNWLEFLEAQKIIQGILTTQQFEAKDFSNGRAIEIKNSLSEEEIITKIGLKYFRLYVSDHRAPLDGEVENFIKFYNQLPENTWLHFHCRGGKGRSTSFLAMVDMLKNADKVSFEEIIARQASIPPFYNLAEVNRIDPELTPFYEERLRFLKKFYQYSQESLSGYEGSWIDWKFQHVSALADLPK